MPPRPRPSHFTDYRAYLKAMVAFLKATTRAFSYRAFARRAGFSSSGFLKHVIEGERSLSAESIARVSKGLGLGPDEAGDFETLVLLDQAATDEAKTRLLRRLRARKGRRELGDDEFELFSDPRAVALRELLTMAGAPSKPALLARRAWPACGVAEVRRALGVLRDLGLLRETEAGELVVQRGTLETKSEVKSLAVRNYHRQMLERAQEALDGLPQQERNVTSLTVKLTDEDYERVCRRIGEFQDELLELLECSDPNAEQADVFNLSFCVVPATRRKSL